MFIDRFTKDLLCTTNLPGGRERADSATATGGCVPLLLSVWIVPRYKHLDP